MVGGSYGRTDGGGGYGDLRGDAEEVDNGEGVPESWRVLWEQQREQPEEVLERERGRLRRRRDHGAGADWSREDQERADSHE